MGVIRTHIPEFVLAEAKTLRETGLSWAKIARRLQCSAYVLEYRLDPQTGSRKRAYNRGYEAKRRAEIKAGSSTRKLIHQYVAPPITQAELEAHRALIPVDTRDNTARLMGDPIPGDRRRA